MSKFVSYNFYRFLIYTVLAMPMGKWCLLMLPVHRGSQVLNFLQLWQTKLSPTVASLIYFLLLLRNIVIENICGNDNVLNHLSIPAACFTHPEISMVGLTEVSNVYHYYQAQITHLPWCMLLNYDAWISSWKQTSTVDMLLSMLSSMWFTVLHFPWLSLLMVQIVIIFCIQSYLPFWRMSKKRKEKRKKIRQHGFTEKKPLLMPTRFLGLQIWICSVSNDLYCFTSSTSVTSIAQVKPLLIKHAMKS